MRLPASGYITATAAIRRIKTRELSPVDLTETVIKCSEEANPTVNAYTDPFSRAASTDSKAGAAWTGRPRGRCRNQPRPGSGRTGTSGTGTDRRGGRAEDSACRARITKDAVRQDAAKAIHGIADGRDEPNPRMRACSRSVHRGLCRSPAWAKPPYAARETDVHHIGRIVRAESAFPWNSEATQSHRRPCRPRSRRTHHGHVQCVLDADHVP